MNSFKRVRAFQIELEFAQSLATSPSSESFLHFSLFPCSLERAASAGAVREKPPAPDHRPGKLILRHYARQTFNGLHDIGLLRSWALSSFDTVCVFVTRWKEKSRTA